MAGIPPQLLNRLRQARRLIVVGFDSNFIDKNLYTVYNHYTVSYYDCFIFT